MIAADPDTRETEHRSGASTSFDASAGSKRAEGAFWLAVALIIAGGAVLRMPTFLEGWTGNHNAWGGAFYGNVARNFLRYGYWATAFAPVVNSGVVDPGQFEIYYHHPPLTVWLTSVSFLVFGVHEWSARLVPLIFSLLTMLLVVTMARSAYGMGAALGALVVLAVLPGETYYAMHVDPNSSVSLFFTTLTVEGYRRWLGSGRGRDYALMVVALVLGCLTAWFAYLVVPGILAHGWLIHRPGERRAMLARLWPLPAIAVALFALFLVHRQIALSGGRPEVYDTLAERVRMRTLDFRANLGAIMLEYFRYIWWLYTAPVVALSAAWFSYFLYGLWKRRLQAVDWCILILWSYGILYALIFPGHLPHHDFFVRTYAPGVALASGAALWRIASAMGPPMARRAVIGLVLTAVSVIGVRETRLRNGKDNRATAVTLRGFGEAVGALTTPRDPVFYPLEDRVLQYYLDRPVTPHLDTPDKLAAAVAAVTGPYLIIVPEQDAERFPELLTYLRNRYPERRDKGLFLFQGTGGLPAGGGRL